MIDAVVFNSNSGHVRLYAIELCEKLSLPGYTIKEAKKMLPKHSNIIYMSWICDNKVVNYDKMNRYNIVFNIGVGITPISNNYANIIKEKTNTYSEVFYLRGGINTKRIGFFKLLTLRRIREELSFKLLNKTASSDEIDILESILKNKKHINYEDLNPIIKYAKNLISSKCVH